VYVIQSLEVLTSCHHHSIMFVSSVGTDTW